MPSESVGDTNNTYRPTCCCLTNAGTKIPPCVCAYRFKWLLMQIYVTENVEYKQYFHLYALHTVCVLADVCLIYTCGHPHCIQKSFYWWISADGGSLSKVTRTETDGLFTIYILAKPSISTLDILFSFPWNFRLVLTIFYELTNFSIDCTLLWGSLSQNPFSCI